MVNSKKPLDIVIKAHKNTNKNEKDIKNIMSQEDYLEAIYTLSKEKKEIKSVDLANAMNVSRPAVKAATEKLISQGLIQKEHYSHIQLTEKGCKIGEEIYQKHITILNFLLSIGCSEEIAAKDCCKIEHVISDETLQKINEFLNKK